MNETSFVDLPNLARHLRSKLADKAQVKPDKSPFVLLYAYNGTGKTRLSAAFKNLGKVVDENDEVQSRDTLYYNAFTEDLFSWDNDLEYDEHRTLKLNAASSFFVGLNELEIENRIRPLLDRYADFDFKINFAFDERTGNITSAEVTFSREVQSGVGTMRGPTRWTASRFRAARRTSSSGASSLQSSSSRLTGLRRTSGSSMSTSTIRSRL